MVISAWHNLLFGAHDLCLDVDTQRLQGPVSVLRNRVHEMVLGQEPSSPNAHHLSPANVSFCITARSLMVQILPFTQEPWV